MLEGLKIFAGNSNKDLAGKICEYLGVQVGRAEVSTFSDGEIQVEIDENVRGSDVFLIQSLSKPVNNNFMELLIMIDALKRASADRITAVLPYYGYARQDRKVAPRAPITAKLVADLLTTAGAGRMLTVDLHAGQIQGFFNIPVDNLYATPVLLSYFKEKFADSDLVVVSPDAGGVERARAFAKRLGAGLAIIDKRRESPNVAKVMNIVGDVKGKKAVLFDDMIDTGGSIVLSAQAVIDNGGERVFACATHPVFSGKAIEKLTESPLQEVVVTDTIPIDERGSGCAKLKIMSIAEILGEAIRRINRNDSVSSLFV